MKTSDKINYHTIMVRLNGVGWNAIINYDSILLNVGYSHTIKIQIPNHINVKTQTDTLLEISSNIDNLTSLGDFVSSMLRIRPWNCYSGHGIIRMDRSNSLVRRRGKR